MKRKQGMSAGRGTLRACTAALLLVQALVVAPQPLLAATDNNVRLRGALVAEPCVVLPGDEEIPMDFGTIIDKHLYLNTRTPGQAFEIRLAECDLTLGNTLTVMFQGTENPALKGLLAIEGSSVATGIAIGLETPDARPLPLNKESGKYRLQKGSNVIALKAYVQGEPEALSQRSIKRGPFSAVATFSLVYE